MYQPVEHHRNKSEYRPLPLDRVACLLERAHRALLNHDAVQAKEICLGVLAEDARQPRALHMLGMAFLAMGKPDAAIAMLRRAVEAAPRETKYLYRLAHTLYQQKRLDEAAVVFLRITALEPERSLAYSVLGLLRREQRRLDEAIAYFRCALQRDPNLYEERVNLGATLQQAGRQQEAIEVYEEILQKEPERAEAWSNLGAAYDNLARWDEALAVYHRAVALDPTLAKARWNVTAHHLMRGEWRDGWGDYDLRWKLEDFDRTKMRVYPCSFWQGEKITGGRVLLWGEQGIGDEIQFLGLLPDALRTGNKFVLNCESRLVPLLARSFPQAQWCASGRIAPEQVAQSGIVAHLPLGSLPRLYRNSDEAFAQNTVPGYLKADPEKVAACRKRYDDGRLLVGISWRSGNKDSGWRRSIALEQLRPLFALPGLRWINLQYGNFEELERQASEAGAPIDFDCAIDPMKDMDGFAAQVAALDLVVTIDNSTVHMAGALGKPAWLLLPKVPDWRWMLEGERSPWYPSLRLFRQSELDQWEPVVERVCAALDDWRRN